MFTYLPADKVAGYSGFVLYHGTDRYIKGSAWDSIWMIPGTFFDDWDNQ